MNISIYMYWYIYIFPFVRFLFMSFVLFSFGVFVLVFVLPLSILTILILFHVPNLFVIYSLILRINFLPEHLHSYCFWKEHSSCFHFSSSILFSLPHPLWPLNLVNSFSSFRAKFKYQEKPIQSCPPNSCKSPPPHYPFPSWPLHGLTTICNYMHA